MAHDVLRAPYLAHPVPCPACEQEGTQPNLRAKLWYPGTVDSDGHVQVFHWRREDTWRLHPPHYFVAFCAHCGFADIRREYWKPSESVHRGRVLKSWRRLRPSDRQVVGLLLSYRHTDPIDFHGALNLHLLAIFIQELPPPDKRDERKLARLYLRVGWLYRENGDLSRTHATALAQLSRLWPDAPTDEAASIAQALPLFERSMLIDRYYSDTKPYLEVLSLVVDLKVRCGRLDEAYLFLAGLYQAAEKERMHNEAIERDREAPSDRRRHAKATLSRVSSFMHDTGALRSDLLDSLMARDKPLIAKVVRRYKSKGRAPLIKALKEAGLNAGQLSRLRDNGTISKKKKGLFSW